MKAALPINPKGQADMVTDTDILRLSTYEEREHAYHTTHQCRDHAVAVAGVIEKDAATVVRMAQATALIEITAARLGLRRDSLGFWRTQKEKP
jgi:hypothetical protein